MQSLYMIFPITVFVNWSSGFWSNFQIDVICLILVLWLNWSRRIVCSGHSHPFRQLKPCNLRCPSSSGAPSVSSNFRIFCFGNKILIRSTLISSFQVFMFLSRDMFSVDVVWSLCHRSALSDSFIRVLVAHLSRLLHHVWASVGKWAAYHR